MDPTELSAIQYYEARIAKLEYEVAALKRFLGLRY
jgi:hypothetical protein